MPFIWCHASHYSEPVLWITDSDFVDESFDSVFVVVVVLYKVDWRCVTSRVNFDLILPVRYNNREIKLNQKR